MKKKFASKESFSAKSKLHPKMPARVSVVIFLMMFAIVVGVLSSFGVIDIGLPNLFGEKKKEIVSDSNSIIDLNTSKCLVNCDNNSIDGTNIIASGGGSSGQSQQEESIIGGDNNSLPTNPGQNPISPGGDECLIKCKTLREQCNAIGQELKPNSTGCYTPDGSEVMDGNCEVNCFSI